MQPTTDESSSAAPGGWAGPPYAPAIPAATVKRARPWLVALASTLTLLVLILAVGNQWVTDKIQEHIGTDSFGERFIRGLTTYSWRFSPRGGHDVDRLWLASLALVVTAIVLTLLLVAAICRGTGGFGQAFLGAWMVVVVATILAVYVRAAIVDTRGLFGPSVAGAKVDSIFYSPLSPNSSHVLAALAFGLVVGLVAGLTAVLSRTTDVVAPAVPAGYGAPAFGAPADQPGPSYYSQPVPGPIASPSPWSGSDDTSARDGDRAPDDEQQTKALPALDHPSAAPTSDATAPTSEATPAADTEHTTQLPRSSAPDDDGPDGPRHLST
jgi:hypothetical protein